MSGVHPATKEILSFFSHDHLQDPKLRKISHQCSLLAHFMVGELIQTEHGAELTTGLRKLLEAKDCFVRAALPK